MSCLTFSVTSSSSACGSTSLATFLAAILEDETFAGVVFGEVAVFFLLVEELGFVELTLDLLELAFGLALAGLLVFAADLGVLLGVLEAVDLEVLLFAALVVDDFLFVVGMLWDGL